MPSGARFGTTDRFKWPPVSLPMLTWASVPLPVTIRGAESMLMPSVFPRRSRNAFESSGPSEAKPAGLFPMPRVANASADPSKIAWSSLTASLPELYAAPGEGMATTHACFPFSLVQAGKTATPLSGTRLAIQPGPVPGV